MKLGSSNRWGFINPSHGPSLIPWGQISYRTSKGHKITDAFRYGAGVGLAMAAKKFQRTP